MRFSASRRERSTALRALEDFGYVAVDNLPLPLLADLMRSTAGAAGKMGAPLAFGIDTRTYGFNAHELARHIAELRKRRAFTSTNLPPHLEVVS